MGYATKKRVVWFALVALALFAGTTTTQAQITEAGDETTSETTETDVETATEPAPADEADAGGGEETAIEETAEPEPTEPEPTDGEPEWEPTADEPESVGGAEETERVLHTAGAAEMPPQFHIWDDERYGFIKPVVQVSAGLVSFFPASDANPELADYRISTLVLSRLGFEGQLFDFLTFRTVFERNVGFSLARNGPLGTSVWEGTGSFQARENYIRLSKWGVSLTGGIFPDPASVDYIATTTLDMFGMDPYVRDPLLVTGFNQGQGLMLRYQYDHDMGSGQRLSFIPSFSFSAGNPLTSSLAFGFGGAVSALGTLFSAPLRALSNGIPGSDIQMYVMNPSFTFESPWFDIRLGAQFYEVDIDILSEDDQHLSGYNLRGTMQGKILAGDHLLRLFASGAYRTNQQVDVPIVTEYKQDYFGLSLGGGAEYTWRNLAIGGQYYWLQATPDEGEMADGSDLVRTTTQYIVFGVNYYLHAPNVAIGLRYSRNWVEETQRADPPVKSTDTITLTMRLVI